MRFIMNSASSRVVGALLVVFAALATQASAVLITPGDLVVVQVGDGSAGLTSVATVGFLKEFTTAGSPVQTINLPTAASGSDKILTFSGSSTSEGFLQLSPNGQYLGVAGYNATAGTAGVATAVATTVNRTVGVIPVATGVVNSSTALTDAYNGSNIRAAVPGDNGSDIWTSGNGGSGQGASAGVRYTTLGSTTTTGLHSTTTNQRVASIQNGQLYSSTASSPVFGVETVGTGIPTTTGQTVTELPGMPTSGTHSNYDYWFRDANTLYVADDGSAAGGGGIQKWTLASGTWSLQYTLLNNGTTTTGVRGLAGTLDGLGNAVLFATSSAASANTLLTLTDTGAGALSSVLATAPAFTAFRGVEFIGVVPEISSFVMVGLVGVGGLAVRRMRRSKLVDGMPAV